MPFGRKLLCAILVRFFQFRLVPLDFRRVLSVFERLPPIAVPPYFGLKAASAHGKFRPTSDCCTWIRTFLLDFEYFRTISYSSIQFSNILSNLAHFRLLCNIERILSTSGLLHTLLSKHRNSVENEK